MQAYTAASDVSPADVPFVFIRSRRMQQVAIAVFKALVGEGVCGWPNSLLLIQCMFQTLTSGDRSEEEDNRYEFHCIFLFCAGRVATSCNSSIFLINIRYKLPSGVFPRFFLCIIGL